jgi:ABC-type multidrug transport system permease subunit
VWAIVVKEFRELRRDRRMVALMVLIPLLLLVVFGYAARFDVSSVKSEVVGPKAATVAGHLPPLFHVKKVKPEADRASAVADLRTGNYAAVLVTTSAATEPELLVDGADLFDAQAITKGIASAQLPVRVTVLFNPSLRTSAVMVPGIIGILLVFVGTLATSLGVVRERQTGTLEQLAVMPFRPRDVLLGKIVPYFLVAAVDTAVVVSVALGIFNVPFHGSVPLFILGAVLFLFVTLAIGVLISTVSENQGQAIQLTMMTLLPQILLSGFIFPIDSMAGGVRWISYLLPLTYFISVSRGVMLRAAPIGALWFPLLMLAVLGTVVFALSTIRFRRDLAPNIKNDGPARSGPAEPVAAGAKP